MRNPQQDQVKVAVYSERLSAQGNFDAFQMALLFSGAAALMLFWLN